MRSLFLSVFLASGLFASAQFLEETTSVLDKKNGAPLFELREGESIYTAQPAEGWYKISKKVWIDPSNLFEKKIMAGTKLMNKEGEEIGHTMTEVKAYDIKEVEKFRGKNLQTAIIKGYVFKTKIKDGSIPEEKVEELLGIKNRRDQIKGFEELFDMYQFEERTFDDLNVKVLRAFNTTTGDEADFRLILVYRSETSLYAIITNDHTIDAPRVKDEKEEGDFRIIYFYKPSQSQRELMDTILYTYLAL